MGCSDLPLREFVGSWGSQTYRAQVCHTHAQQVTPLLSCLASFLFMCVLGLRFLFARRFEKRHKNMTVHCAPCWQNVKEGDIVTIGQCRPLSKTVRFNVLEHEPCINTVRKLRNCTLNGLPQKEICRVFSRSCNLNCGR